MSLFQAHFRKPGKENYQLLQGDLEAKGFNTQLVMVEIGALCNSLLFTISSLDKILILSLNL